MSIVNGHTFGVFTQSQKGVTFTNVTAEIVDYKNKNNPINRASPNRPRKERWEGVQNPILGDEGNGKIGRWQQIKKETVQELLDQMIEHYLRDKKWYSTIRCREALWNMYRRLAWYVKYEIGEEVSEYRKALQLIKDCIYKIEHPELIDERKIFEELFNVRDRYSSKLTFHEAFEWLDIFDKVIEEEGSDGVMHVEGQLGEFDVSLATINMNYDGYISFQYGGQLTNPDRLEFYINDKLAWSTKEVATTGNELKTQKVKVNAGPNNFKWVYKSNGGASEPWFWIDVIRLYEYMPVYSKYHIGYVETLNPPEIISGGFDYTDLTMTGGWYLIDGELDKFIYDGAYDYVAKTVRIDTDEAFFQFEYSISRNIDTIETYITVIIDGVEVWWSYGETHGTEYIRIDNLPKGEYEISVVFQAIGAGESHIIFKNFAIFETRPTDRAHKKYVEMGIPYCPAPYLLHYNGAFYVDFDGEDKHSELYDSAKEPLWADLPGLFRYVSSSEEQEWEAVGYVEPPVLQYDEDGNLIEEPPPPENILKFPIGKLKHGNHTKVTTLWKFKEKGSISFDFLASTGKGNGLVFFINGRQVSPEWNERTEWDSVTYNVEPGQTYKFDWLVRRKNVVEWGYDAIFIKNIKFYEVIPPTHPFIPPSISSNYGGIDLTPEQLNGDFDLSLLPTVDKNIWFTEEHLSVMSGGFKGDRTYTPKVHERTLCGGCHGELMFSYTLDVEEPNVDDMVSTFFFDDFVDEPKHEVGVWGKDEWSGGPYDWNTVTAERYGFTFDGIRASTIESVVYDYNIHVFKDYLLDRNRVGVRGQVSIECPPRYIHHYDETDTTPEFNWNVDGIWQDQGSLLFVDGSFEAGEGTAETRFNMEYDGTLSFNLNFNIGSNDKLEIYVDGSSVYSNSGPVNELISRDLTAGEHSMSFKLTTSGDGEDVTVPVASGATYHRYHNYAEEATGGQGQKVTAPNTLVTDGKGSEVQIFRNRWIQGDGPRTYTESDSLDFTVDFKIAPGATLSYKENVRFVTGADISAGIAEPYESKEGDTCYPAGTSTKSMSYNLLKGSVKTATNDVLDWDDNKPGASKGATPTYHYTVTDNLSFTRTIKASSLSDLVFSEDVTVYNGISTTNNSASARSLLSLDLQAFASMTPIAESVSRLHVVADIQNRGASVSASPQFYTSGKVKLSVKITSSANNKVGIQVYLKGTGGTYYVIDKTGSVNGTYNFEENLPAGNYIAYFRTARGNMSESSARGLWVKYDGINISAAQQSTVPSTPKPPTTVPTTPNKPPTTTRPPSTTTPPVESRPPVVVDACAGVDRTKGDAPDGADDYVYPGYLITKCMQGSYVGVIQESLGITVDGNYGPATEEAVKQFQRNNGISPSGKVNWDTWKALVAYSEPPDPPQATDYTQFPGNLTLGDTGGYVKAMQLQLVYKGYRDRIPLADGIFDEITLEQLNRFQEDYGFPIRDYIDSAVWAKLFGNESPPAYQDETVVEVVVRSGGTIVSTDYLSTSSESETFNYTVDVPKGETYTVTYTLQRGAGTKGGLLDKGGGMSVTGGRIEANTVAYCKKKNGSFYAQESTDTSEGGGSATLGNPTFTVTVSTIGYNQTFSGEGGMIDVQYTNDTEQPVTFKLTGRLNRDKSTDQVELNRGEVIIAQPGEMETKRVPDAIQGQVSDIRVVEQVPHWTGGCDMYNFNNFIYVSVVDCNDNEIARQEFNGSGIYTFEFTDLAPLPCPDYKVRIETVQGGGYDYMHPPEIVAFNPYSFHIDNFEVFEVFKAIPDPFNSVLDFYIDDEFMGTYKQKEFNEYLELIFDVSKGCHTYKWVIRQIDDRAIWPWDRAKVDWVELTNWVCDEILITPYCVRGGGDKCIEALIKCLMPVLPPTDPEIPPIIPDPEDEEDDEEDDKPIDPEPLICKIGKKIWLFT